MRAFFFIVAFAVTGGSASATPSQGFFISIDGLRPDRLQILSDADLIQAPRGLGWLQRTALRAERATPVITTLTAASHASTITCTTPARHGVIANSFLEDGEIVSGFSHDIATETLWQAAMRQGKKVLSLAYVGADGLTPERSVDAGVAYPSSSLMGERQQIEWKWDDLADASGWTGLREGTGDFKEETLTIVLNGKTDETRVVNVLIVKDAQGRKDIRFDLDKDLSNGVLARLLPGGATHADLFFTESSADSDLPGRKRRVTSWRLPAPDGELRLYLSAASYNNAHPESFRKALDDQGLVWPDYGVQGEGLALDLQVEGEAMIDRFLTDVGRFAMAREHYDVVLFYQPLIDTMGHEHEAELADPFDPKATDELTRAYVKAFQIVDQNVSNLLQGTGANDVVALMGDHGMDPIAKMVNLAELMPSGAETKIKMVTSGAMALLYAAPGATEEEAHAVGQELATRLTALRDGTASVLGAAHGKDAREGLSEGSPSEWQYGEAVWAFLSGSGYWFTHRPLDQDLWLPPDIPGMHGQPADLPSMATALLFKGPGLRPGRLGTVSLLDAVPTFSRLMEMDPPRDCMGQSLAR